MIMYEHVGPDGRQYEMTKQKKQPVNAIVPIANSKNIQSKLWALPAI